jgi:hypothetical protein
MDQPNSLMTSLQERLSLLSNERWTSARKGPTGTMDETGFVLKLSLEFSLWEVAKAPLAGAGVICFGVFWHVALSAMQAELIRTNY